MARTEKGVALLKEKASELAKLEELVKNLATENEFDIRCYEDNESIYSDWNNSSCYGEESGEDFGVDEEGTIWYPSSC